MSAKISLLALFVLLFFIYCLANFRGFELSTKEKKSFESVMNGDQIKKQIYEDRLLILKKLEAE